ncbi:hypothetical protein P4O66_004797, partial [Electrophorus voltai]
FLLCGWALRSRAAQHRERQEDRSHSGYSAPSGLEDLTCGRIPGSPSSVLTVIRHGATEECYGAGCQATLATRETWAREQGPRQLVKKSAAPLAPVKQAHLEVICSCPRDCLYGKNMVIIKQEEGGAHSGVTCVSSEVSVPLHALLREENTAEASPPSPYFQCCGAFVTGSSSSSPVLGRYVCDRLLLLLRPSDTSAMAGLLFTVLGGRHPVPCLLAPGLVRCVPWRPMACPASGRPLTCYLVLLQSLLLLLLPRGVPCGGAEGPPESPCHRAEHPFISHTVVQKELKYEPCGVPGRFCYPTLVTLFLFFAPQCSVKQYTFAVIDGVDLSLPVCPGPGRDREFVGSVIPAEPFAGDCGKVALR